MKSPRVSTAFLFLVLLAAPFRSSAADALEKGTPSEAASQTETLAPPHVEATLLGPNPAYVGQMVTVEVALFRDDRQKDQPAPFFPEVRVNDAIVVLSSSAPPPETRTIENVPFLVQKRHYLVFPQAEGQLTIPPVSVSLPLDDDKTLAVDSLPLELRADIPRGAGLDLPLVARHVTLERTIDGNLDRLRVGETFTVRMHLAADDTDSLLLPELAPGEISGLSRYPGQPVSRTQADRGSYHAERTDSATYVANEWGFYHLPAVSVLWLDPTTGSYARAAVPALSFRARVNPSLDAGCLGGPRAAARVGGVVGFVLLAVFLALRWMRRRSEKRAQLARVPRSAEEKAAFSALLHAAESERDGPTLSALYRWLRYSLTGVPTLSTLREVSQDEDLKSGTTALEDRVCDEGRTGRAKDLVAPLVAYRKSQKRDDERPVLPPLNGK